MADQITGTEAHSSTSSATDTIPGIGLPASAPRAESQDNQPQEGQSKGNATGQNAEKTARAAYRKLAGTSEPVAESNDEDKGSEKDEAGSDRGEGAKGQSKEKPDTDADRQAKLDAAWDALVRDGWTVADLKKLSTDRILAMGERRREAQANQDRFGTTKAQEIAQLRQKLAELESPGTSAGKAKPAAGDAAGDAGSEQGNAEGDPLDQLLSHPRFKGVTDALDEIGQIASPEVQGVMKKMVGQLVNTLSAEVGTVTRVAEEQALRSARTRLADDFPDVKEEKHFTEKVVPKMRSLAKTGDYGPGDYETLMRDACQLVSRPASQKDIQRKMLEESRRAADGQIDVGQTKRGNDKPLSADDKAREIFRHLQKGKSPTEAAAAVA